MSSSAFDVLRPCFASPLKKLHCLVIITAIFCAPLWGQSTDWLPSSPKQIQWSPRSGVARYRLQIARDKQFSDVFYDGLVTGSRYYVRDLDPGVYYWRVATANGETGAFQGPVKLRIEANQRQVSAAKVKSSPTATASSGWLTTTGEVKEPLTVRLPSVSGIDLLAVNSQGIVYALDSLTGVAIWTTRFDLSTKREEEDGPDVPDRLFVPLLFDSGDTTSRVIVAFEKGVRALEAATGRELWRALVPNQLVGGLIERDLSNVYLLTERTKELIILDGQTGRLKTRVKLMGSPSAAPVLLRQAEEQVLIVPLISKLEVRRLNGELARTIDLETNLTTPPVIISHDQKTLLLIGTKLGLAAFDMNGFVSLRRISTGAREYPTGVLSIADLDGDSMPEAVMVTNRGGIMAVDLREGKIQWRVDGGEDAASTAFFDLDGDGKLDVLAPGSRNFAIGLSGRDGALIWQSEEELPLDCPCAQRRSLSAVRTRAGNVLLVGPDLEFKGLRAIDLQKQAARPMVP